MLILCALAVFALILLVSAVTAQEEEPVTDWPEANAGGNYSVEEGDWVMVDASGSHGMYEFEPNGYRWDLDNDGTFETEGFSAWFDASGRDGAGNQVVGLEVCYEMACDTDVATVSILNVAPQLDAGSNATVYSGQTFSLSGIFTDPGVNDLHSATVNYDNGNGNVGASIFEGGGAGLVTGQNTYFTPRLRNVSVCISDDDGASSCDTLQVNVLPVTVPIDIKPFYNSNTVNLQSDDHIKVAILAGGTIDIDDINPYTITLASAPMHSWSLYYDDVNNDNLDDMIVRVDMDEMTVTQTAVQATMNARTYGGIYLAGTDVIDLVPPPAPTPSLASSYPYFYWSAVNGGVCYQVEIDHTNDFSSPEQIATNVEGYYYSADALPSGNYYWRVRVGGVCVNVVQSGWSAPRAFTVP
jgi:hypothetical protein